jgi:pimeloyl-ACP methyl ester carboxylesterase
MTTRGLRSDLVVRRAGLPAGPGTPTLLLLHGLTDSGRGWPEAIRHWESDYAMVLVDQRGHGESPRFTAAQLDSRPGDQMVADAIGILEQLDRPVVVGHSLGGAVALTAAVRRPELVRAVVLEDPAPLGPDEPEASAARGAEYVEGIRPSLAARDDQSLLDKRREQHPDWPESELLVTGRAEQQMDIEYLARGDWKPTTPWPELFERLTVPALVVSGDDPDEICVDAAMERGLVDIANLHVTLTRVAGAGHCIRRDQPQAFYDVVDAWLAKVEWGPS